MQFLLRIKHTFLEKKMDQFFKFFHGLLAENTNIKCNLTIYNIDFRITLVESGAGMIFIVANLFCIMDEFINV